MDIDEACRILAFTHTRDDGVAGFIVQMGAVPVGPYPTNAEYVEAWRVIRTTGGLPVEPIAPRTPR